VIGVMRLEWVLHETLHIHWEGSLRFSMPQSVLRTRHVGSDWLALRIWAGLRRVHDLFKFLWVDFCRGWKLRPTGSIGPRCGRFGIERGAIGPGPEGRRHMLLRSGA
jgi:hypothetical protein